MWATNRVTIWMMASEYLRKISLTVHYMGGLLYTGIVTTIDDSLALGPPRDGSLLSHRGRVLPSFLVSVPTDSTTVVLRNLRHLDDDPHYELSFQFLPTRMLTGYNIYQALLALLLEEGKADAESTQQRISLSRREYKAWVFMMQSHLPMRGKDLRMFEAVAIAEAMARHQVFVDRFGEMTFRLLVDGEARATGCITKAVHNRRWCSGMSRYSRIENLS